MTSGSSIQAIEHSVPPHFGPVSISMVLKVTPTLGNVLMLKGTPTQGNVQGDKFTLTPFIEFQTFHFYMEEADAEVWSIVGPFGIETHAENEEDIKRDVDDYLCYLWRTYVETEEPLTNKATHLRNELLQAVGNR